PIHTFGIDVADSYSGTLQVHLDALDAAANLLASGEGSTPLASGMRRDIAITLGAPGIDGGLDDGSQDAAPSDGGSDLADAAPPTIATRPPSPPLWIGFGRPFTASAPATFAVVESEGGTVDDGGAYVAPATPGTYHVRATSVDTPATATATVTVNS